MARRDNEPFGGVLLYDAYDNPITYRHGDSVDSESSAIAIGGRDSSSLFRWIRTDRYGNIQSTPSENTQSAFGETKVSEPYQLANLLFKYNIDPLAWGTDVVGSATVTHVAAKSAAQLYVSSADADNARLRTHDYYQYRFGLGLFVRLNVWHSDEGQTNQVREWGIFTENDGLLWKLDGTALKIVVRTSTSGSPVETVYTQANWSNDPMDGTGPSGLDLDITKNSTYEIQFQWGAGIINFFIDGVLTHKIEGFNKNASPFMQTADLPISFSMKNNGASTAGYMYTCGSAAMIESGEDLPDYSFGAYIPSYVLVSPTERPILSIRPKLTFNGIENRMRVIPVLGKIANDGKRASYRVILDGTLGGGTNFNSVADDSGVEFDYESTTISGGLTMLAGLLPQAIDSDEIKLSMLFHDVSRALRREAFTSNVNTLTITAKNDGSSGGDVEMRASINWWESR